MVPFLFHCATSSEPFVSFNALESDGPPRACQKRLKSPLCEGRVDNFPHYNQVPSIRFDLRGRGMDFHLRSLRRVMRKKMTLAFHRREWGFKKKRISSALSDNKGDEWSRFVPLCDVVRAGLVDNFPDFNQGPSVQFDLGEGDGLPSSLSAKRCEKKMSLAFRRREWGFKKKRILSALSDNKGDEWSVLFHCATSSEPFVSFNAPESDEPPRACQKVCNIPLFVLLFSRQRSYCPTMM
ncbi:hypothetical protein CEXT_33051 [Caerostris extrusa]|uniref:Uncharacterized protein n=1 Tax=Caerostris extrusa TaxID=172846 RepID=A0AAV4Q7P1_CAEEX|nr:hypothetical protein CEXT_33051 [Caerostris extrusa]